MAKTPCMASKLIPAADFYYPILFNRIHSFVDILFLTIDSQRRVAVSLK
jgi:hypothetical protein